MYSLHSLNPMFSQVSVIQVALQIPEIEILNNNLITFKYSNACTYKSVKGYCSNLVRITGLLNLSLSMHFADMFKTCSVALRS